MLKIKDLINNTIIELEAAIREDKYDDEIEDIVAEIHYDIVSNDFSFKDFQFSTKALNLLENYNEKRAEQSACSYWG